MADDDIHVIKDGDDWRVAIEGQGDLVSFDTEEEAVHTARRIAESVSSEAVIHGDVVPRGGGRCRLGICAELDRKRTSMAEGDVHVVRGAGWRIEIEGIKRAQSTHTRQREAREAAKQIPRRRNSEAYLHGRDGKIRERTTYGADQRRINR